MAKRIGTTTQGFERFDDGGVVQNVETSYVDTEGDGTYAKTHASRLYVWSAGILDWIRWDGSVTGGIGGGGGGGPVTVADGADVAQGSTLDPSSANTVVGLLKAIKAALTSTLTIAGNVGRTWTLSSGTDSVNVGNLPATQAISAAALPLPAGAAKDSTLTDGSQRVGGTVAVSAAALPLPAGAATESGLGTDGATPPAIAGTGVRGWLRAIYEKLTGSIAVTGTFWQATQPVSIASMPSTPVTGPLTDTQLRATAVPISAASLPTHGVTIADGSDVAQGTTTDTSAANTVVGILKAIKAAVTGTLAVSGTFWQATQPVSLATNTPDVTDRAARLLGVVSAPVGTPVFVRLSDGAAALVGQKTAALGVPVTLASDQTVVDNAGFTDGTTPLVMGGYILDEIAGTALTENDAAAARIDSKRAVVNVIEDGATRGTRATIKASSVAPLATDTALVVVPRLTPSEGTAFASASRAAGTYTFDIADTTGFSGIAIVTDLTVLGASSTVTNSIQVKDPVTGKFATATAAAFTAVNAVSTTRQAMHPANAGASGNLQGGVMTKAIRVNVVVATAASTFSVGYSLTP